MSRDLRHIFTKNLRTLRMRASYTQEGLALKCGMHDNYISKIELCKIGVGLDNLEKIAKALGVKPSLLLEPDGWKSAKTEG